MDNIMGVSWMALFSGLFGVLIGSLISYALVRYREWLAAKYNLAHILFQIAEDFSYTNKSVEEILRPRFIDLWILGRDVSNLMISCKRRDIKDKTDLICGSMRGIMKDKTALSATRSFPAKKDAQKHTDDLLKLLGYR